MPTPPGPSNLGKPENRVVRACDNCYKNKNKCMLAPRSQVCENCKFFGLECTFLREKKKRGPPKGYIDAIENRIGRIETVLYGLVEQQKQQPTATGGLLPDIAQDVRDLQKIARAAENEEAEETSGEFGGGFFQAFQPSSHGPPKIPPPVPSNRPLASMRRYTSGDISSRPSATTGNGSQPRESQRRRIHPPEQSLSPTQEDMEDETGTSEESEMVQMAGQLSLDENRTVRYHGSSSGLTLLTQSKRFDGTFWNLPNPGFWPLSDKRSLFAKTELEIDLKTPLPPLAVQDRLLDLYWEHVHPYVPLFYKDHFLKQLARDRQNPLSQYTHSENSLDQYERRIPYVLLFTMFAIAARYEVPDPAIEAEALNRVWTAGEEYLHQARETLYHYNSSTISCCHALILMAYHGVGTGLAGTWAYSGYAVRMAQDLGLHRDPGGWMKAFPALKFSREEVEVRRRTWWTIYIIDKYICAWQGRPTTIVHQEFDTQFPEDAVNLGGSSPSTLPASFADTEGTFACFNRCAMLTEIQAEITLSFYSVKPTRNKRELMRLERLLLEWESALPSDLQIYPGSLTIPPKNVILLHAQFHNCRLLLHRPFVMAGHNRRSSEGSGSPSAPSTAAPMNESHIACTAAAGAITNLLNLFKHHGWRSTSPLFIYYVFSAAITHIFDATTHPSLAQTATRNLQLCLAALKQMGVAWPSASRSYMMIGDAPRLADNLGLPESEFPDLGEDFGFGESRGVKRHGEGDAPMASLFGDEAYDAIFWNQIANSTELPWNVVYQDDPQDQSYL